MIASILCLLALAVIVALGISVCIHALEQRDEARDEVRREL